MRIVNLASGSKGNCTFIGFEDSKILIDAGISASKIAKLLNEIGEDINTIKAVCITHEHIDHIRGIKTLSKKYGIDIFVHEKLANEDCFKNLEINNDKIKTFKNDPFFVGDLIISPFDIFHDAVAPVGFTINVKNSKSKFGVITDTGKFSDSIKNALIHSKMVLIESNYDNDMLWNGNYPFQTKVRISGDHGHLSNSQSLELAKYLFDNGTKCFILSHLSENNNTQEKAYMNYVSFFEKQNLVLDKDVFIRLSFQNKHGNNFILKEEY